MKNTNSLTKEEAAWCKSLEKLLLAAPARFGLYTVGDCYLHVFDADAVSQREVDIADGGVDKAGLVLALVKSRVLVHSLSG